MTGRAAAFVLVAAAPLAVSAGGQQTAAQKPPIFRSGTAVVPLTVTVLDKAGKPVTDLTQADFTVFEDSRPREIVNFFPQRLAPSPVPPRGSAALNRAAPSATLTPQTRRTFLFVLGYGRIQYPTRAIDGVIEFVREKLLPQDLAGVLAFNRATDFTTDRAQTLRVLERYKAQHEKVLSDIKDLYALILPGVPLPHIPRRIQDQIDAIFTGPPAKPGSAASDPVRNATEMLLGMNPLQPLTEKPWDKSQAYDEIRTQVYRDNNIQVFAGIEYLRFLDGEKHLVFLGRAVGAAADLPGRNPPWHKEDDVRLARRASDARVAVDIIHTGGPTRSTLTIQSSQHVTALTGGYFTGVSYANDALAVIDQSTRFSYLLGYTPSNPSRDGAFRNVSVKVNRPGVTVRFQHGYYAVDELAPLQLQELLVASRLEAVGGIAQEALSIKLKAEATPLPRMGINATIRVDITIDPADLAFTTADGRRAGQLEIQAYAGDAKERTLGEANKRVDLSADEATFAEWTRTGVRQSIRITVPAGVTTKYVKVVVYDYGSDRLGSLHLTIK
jgi:VWFA-related protein